jgi:hypothetical protein
MIRRLLAVVALAAAVALTPMAAFGATYPAPESALTCNKTAVVVNSTFTCTIQGPAGESATLTATTAGANPSIAGTVSLTKVIPGTNAAVFTVTAPASATTIAFAGSVATAPTNGASVAVTSVTLGATGANIGVALGAGSLLVLGGAALIIGSRRRSKTTA